MPKLDWELVGSEGNASFHHFNEACRQDPYEVAQVIGSLLLDAEQGKAPQEYMVGTEYKIERVLVEGGDGRRFAYGSDAIPGTKVDSEAMHHQTDRVYGSLWDDPRYTKARLAARNAELGEPASRARGLTVLDMILRHNAEQAGIVLPNNHAVIEAELAEPTKKVTALATAA